MNLCCVFDYFFLINPQNRILSRRYRRNCIFCIFAVNTARQGDVISTKLYLQNKLLL